VVKKRRILKSWKKKIWGREKKDRGRKKKNWRRKKKKTFRGI